RGCPCPPAAALPRGATPVAGVVAPAGGRAGRGRQPLAGPALLAATAPCGLALVSASRSLVGGLGRGMAVASRPCMGVGRPSSLRPSLQKRSKNA
ncbi:hypothetical protein BHE74_00023337, partial [Ensete ventricosum]